MKRINLAIITLSILVSGIVSSCKKDTTDPSTNNSTTNTTAKQTDQQGSTEADDAIKDVNDFINNKVGGGSTHRTTAYDLPCGVVKVDSTKNSSGNYNYVFTYGNKTPCGYKYKSGSISFELISGTAFNQAGAIFRITYTDYVVQAQASGQTIKINGSVDVTNVNGGYIWETVINSKTIVHKLRGTFKVTYADNTERTRHYYQLRTWASSNSWAGLSLTASGDTLIGGVKVSEMGKTYEGNYDYQNQILTDLKWANCGTTYAGPYVLKTGDVKINVTVPAISPAYIDIESGYYVDYSKYSNTVSTAIVGNKVNDCTSNAYKITTVIGQSTTIAYQFY
jgi:hypothetical protein